MERVLFCVQYGILAAGREVVAIKRKYTQQEVEQHMRGRIYCNPHDSNLVCAPQDARLMDDEHGQPVGVVHRGRDRTGGLCGHRTAAVVR